MAELSNKKLKRIRRLQGEKSVAEIARECGVSEKQVRRALDQNAASNRETTAPADPTHAPDVVGWLLAVLIVVAPLAPVVARTESYDPGNLPQMLFLWAGITALLTVWLVRGAVFGGLEIRTSPLLLPLGVVVGWSVLSLGWTVNRHDGFFTAFHWGVCLIAFFLTLQVAADKRRADRLLFALLASGAVVCLIGIGQRFFGLDIVQQVAPPAATFANKNHAAHFVVLTLPVGAGLLLRKPLGWHGIVFGCALLVELVFLVCTRTKGAWLAAMVQAGVFAASMLYLRFRDRLPLVRRSAKATAVVACCVGVAWWMCSAGAVNSRGHAPFGWGRESASLTTVAAAETVPGSFAQLKRKVARSFAVRTWYWRNSTALFRKHPWIGVGVYNWKIHYPLYSQAVVQDTSFSLEKNPRTSHNDYVQFACEFGVVGVLLACWLLFACVRLGVLLGRRWSGWWGIEHVLIPVTAIAGTCMNATLSSPLYKAIPPFAVAIYLGLLSNAAHAAAGPGEPAARRVPVTKRITAPPFVIGLSVAAGVFCVVVILFAGRFRLADIHYARMTTWSNVNRAQKALEEAARVEHYNPWRKRVLFYRGRSHLTLGDPRKAAAALAELERYYPYSITGMTNLALSYMQMGELAKAHGTADRMIALFPDPGTAYGIKADAYLRGSDKARALDMYRKAFKAGVHHAEIMYNYGSTAWQLGEAADAAKAFRKAVALKPDWVMARMALGLVHSQGLKDVPYALKVWNKALDCKPTETEEKQLRHFIAKYSATPEPPVQESPTEKP